MVKTLRITSVIVVVLAIGLFVFPMVFGFRSDEEIEQFLNSPGAIERFLQTRESKAEGGEDQVSPLIGQAGAFARYLNPPAPAPPKPGTAKGPPEEPITPDIPKPHRATPKFKVIATSFCGSSPELSLALIDEPGKGRHWVRERSVVGHLTIERIKDGVVIAKGIKESFESVVEQKPPRISLLMGSSSVSTLPGGQRDSKSVSVSGSPEAVSGTRADAGVISSAVEQMSEEEQAALAEKIFAELEATFGDAASGKVDLERSSEEKTAVPGERGSGPEATRISGEEAKELGDLGRELKNVPEDPERAKARKDRKERIRRQMEERRKRLAERRERLRKKDK